MYYIDYIHTETLDSSEKKNHIHSLTHNIHKTFAYLNFHKNPCQMKNLHSTNLQFNENQNVRY